MSCYTRIMDKEKNGWDSEYAIPELDIMCGDRSASVLVCNNKTPVLLLHIFIEIDKGGFFQRVAFVPFYAMSATSPVPDYRDDKLSENILLTTDSYIYQPVLEIRGL